MRLPWRRKREPLKMWQIARPVAAPLPISSPGIDAYEKRLRDALRFFEDMDRCEHGRHSIDNCWGCPGGQSTGNPHLVEGNIIGYDHAGRPYRVTAGGRGSRDDWLGVQLP